jgi:DNA integrity scanning protein DisA with diadenylate cyclase activity
MSEEPESLILQVLRDMRADTAELKSDMRTLRADMAEVKSDMQTLRADVAADFIDTRREIAGVRKELSEQIVGLRRAVVEYHFTLPTLIYLGVH